MRIPLFGSSYRGITAALDTQKSTNLYEEFATSQHAKSPSALIGVPGLDFYRGSDGAAVTFSGGQLRGIFTIQPVSWNDNETFLVVHGPTVSLVALDGTKTDVGSIAVDSSPVNFAENTTQVLICSAERLYVYNKATAVVTGPVVFTTSGDEVIAHSVAALAGRFLTAGAVAAADAGKIQYSSIESASFAEDDYFSAEFNPDMVRWIRTENLLLWAFGEASAQAFQATDDPNQPFAPILGAVIARGLLAFRSIAKAGPSLFWLGSDQDRGGMAIYRLQGWQAEIVSDGFAEQVLSDVRDQYGMAGIQGGVAWGYHQANHDFYVLNLTLGKTSLVYDVTTDKWHERRYWNQELGEWDSDIPWVHGFVSGQHLVGDCRAGLGGGGLYILSHNYSDQNILGGETEIRGERISPHFSGQSHERLFFSELEIDLEAGVGLTSGQGSDPKIMLSMSDDGGKTFGEEIHLTTGKIGAYRWRTRLARCGSAFDRVFSVAVSDPIRWRLVAASCDVRSSI